jgi:hypothetical protein
MYLGFFLYGALTLVFVLSLSCQLRPTRRARSAVLFLALYACGPLLATFTMGTEHGPPQSVHAGLHFAGFLLLALAPLVGLPLFASAVWGDERWRGLGPFSAVVAVGVAAVVFAPSLPETGYAYLTGPGSIVHLTVLGCWQVVVAIRLGTVVASPSPRQQTATSVGRTIG